MKQHIAVRWAVGLLVLGCADGGCMPGCWSPQGDGPGGAVLLGGRAVQAAEPEVKTEVFTFRHVPISRVQDFLLDRHTDPLLGLGRRDGQGGGLGGPRMNPVPKGISAWSADPTQGRLTATGTPQALLGLRTIFRLLDVPRRRIRMQVRLVDLPEDALPAQQADGAETVSVTVQNDAKLTALLARARSTPRSLVLQSDEELTALLARARSTRLNLEMIVGNNEPAFVRWQRREGDPAADVLLCPRLNGDGTVTLLVAASQPGAVAPAQENAARGGAERTEPLTLRRLPAGATLLVHRNDGRLPLLVTVREVLPVEQDKD